MGDTTPVAPDICCTLNVPAETLGTGAASGMLRAGIPTAFLCLPQFPGRVHLGTHLSHALCELLKLTDWVAYGHIPVPSPLYPHSPQELLVLKYTRSVGGS